MKGRPTHLPRRGRGKGVRRFTRRCRMCLEPFQASRQDADTCSPRCRKAKNRLFGGSKAVTKMPSVLGKSVTEEAMSR